MLRKFFRDAKVGKEMKEETVKIWNVFKVKRSRIKGKRKKESIKEKSIFLKKNAKKIL